MAVLKTAIESSRGFASMESGAAGVSNTIAESTLYSQLIPAGKMGNNKILKYKLVCEVVTPLVSAGSITIRMKFGASTLILASALGLAANLNSGRPFIISGEIANLSANNSQYVYGEIRQYANDVPIVLSLAASLNGATWAIDTSADQTFSITAQLSLLNATTVITPKIATIDLS